MMIKRPSEIRQLFLDYLLLKEIKRSKTGISGYELCKTINSMIESKMDDISTPGHYKLSQSRVYRILDNYKQKKIVNVKENVIINNRLQNLFQINEKGEQYHNDLLKILQDFFPNEISIADVIGEFLSGKRSPLDIILDEVPEEELLQQLKRLHQFLLNELKRVKRKITELETK